jgi:hypothetical protein
MTLFFFVDINGHHYPNPDTIMHSILKIAKVMNRDDSMLYFFSGHGATLSHHMRKLGNRCICLPDMSCLTGPSSLFCFVWFRVEFFFVLAFLFVLFFLFR